MNMFIVGGAVGVVLAGGFIYKMEEIESNPKVSFTVDSIAIESSGDKPSLSNIFQLESCNPGYENTCYVGVKTGSGDMQFFAVGGTVDELVRPSDNLEVGAKYVGYKDGNRLLGLNRVGVSKL